MITSEEAVKIIGKTGIARETEKINLRTARGRLLAEAIYADRDFPPFNRVTMDGIAINSGSWIRGNRTFIIETLQPAGAPQTTLKNPDNAIEIMTGAVLPENTDVIIKYEETETIDEAGIKKFRVNREEITPYLNVHKVGEDRRKGDLLIPKGKLIASPEIGVMASVGKSIVAVQVLPKIAIIATGDELVDIEAEPLPHQIRKSNIYSIQSELDALGFDSSTFHLKDDKEVLEEKILKIMNEYPVLILSGGVSMGKLDFVPEIMEKLGVTKLFHRVKQRPGKPFWFGRSATNIVFALPGNPVSSFVSFTKYIKGWIYNFFQIPRSRFYARLTEDVIFEPDLTYFLQVKISCNEEGSLVAKPVVGHGSGDHANLLDSNGFMELPADKGLFKKGECYEVLLFRYIFDIS